jgi:hypothetical protein
MRRQREHQAWRERVRLDALGGQTVDRLGHHTQGAAPGQKTDVG